MERAGSSSFACSPVIAMTVFALAECGIRGARGCNGVVHRCYDIAKEFDFKVKSTGRVR